jgi:hypothetical protein
MPFNGSFPSSAAAVASPRLQLVEPLHLPHKLNEALLLGTRRRAIIEAIVTDMAEIWVIKREGDQK